MQESFTTLEAKNLNSVESQEEEFTFAVGAAIVGGVYFALAVHNTVAGAANIYLYFNLWGPGISSYSVGGASRSSSQGFEERTDGLESKNILRKEIIINEIADFKF